jgi:hypothetical protein
MEINVRTNRTGSEGRRWHGKASLFERRFLVSTLRVGPCGDGTDSRPAVRDINSRRDAAWFTFALFLIVSCSKPVDVSPPWL